MFDSESTSDKVHPSYHQWCGNTHEQQHNTKKQTGLCSVSIVDFVVVGVLFFLHVARNSDRDAVTRDATKGNFGIGHALAAKGTRRSLFLSHHSFHSPRRLVVLLPAEVVLVSVVVSPCPLYGCCLLKQVLLKEPSFFQWIQWKFGQLAGSNPVTTMLSDIEGKRSRTRL